MHQQPNTRYQFCSVDPATPLPSLGTIAAAFPLVALPGSTYPPETTRSSKSRTDQLCLTLPVPALQHHHNSKDGLDSTPPSATPHWPVISRQPCLSRLQPLFQGFGLSGPRIALRFGQITLTCELRQVGNYHPPFPETFIYRKTPPPRSPSRPDRPHHLGNTDWVSVIISASDKIITT